LLADGREEERACIDSLLILIESLLRSDEERKRYGNDLLKLENIRDMLGDAYVKAYEHEHHGYLSKIVALMDQGRMIAGEIREENLAREFKIWSSGHPE
jgi:hypothetical protein